ncbi:formate/nitrite transporter family protein [uncultured Clostridium sp.]|uniref:formate/nitrite transporter family protein n=1 Tax=uncultured Clostridium sp. TaxID=59620 RepID=UPI002628F381|nr:formate/nitrite transporter family protein [uncultured Clostridium sp.]
MYSADFFKVVEGAKKKRDFFHDNKKAYIMAAALAGMYVGLAIILAYTVGAKFNEAHSPATKLVMGIVFSVALVLVMFAGAELFTGNNFVMTAGFLEKEVTKLDVIKIWGFSYLGNFIGSFVVAILFQMSGLNKGIVGEYMVEGALSKINVPIDQILVRGILCNILVCLSVWCYIKMKDEGAKIIIIGLCLLVFVTSGFEHSIANMSLFMMGLFGDFKELMTVNSALTNIVFATIGNIIGGAVFVAMPYHLISKTKIKK